MLLKQIKFVKENTQWFVDLPEYLEQGIGVKGNLLMVAGADTFLEMMSLGKDSVDVIISDEPFEGCTILDLFSIGVDKKMLMAYDHPEVEFGGNYMIRDNGYKMWLCPTLLYVFETDEYPVSIYFKVLN